LIYWTGVPLFDPFSSSRLTSSSLKTQQLEVSKWTVSYKSSAEYISLTVLTTVISKTRALSIPAAFAGLAYLNARWRLPVDLKLFMAMIKAQIFFSKRERANRINSFYLIEEHANNPKVASETFILYQGTSWTFKQTYEIVLRYAGYLQSEYSVQPGDIIALNFMNCPQYMFLVLAIWSLGGLPAFINYNLTSEAFVHSVRVSSARLLIIEPEVEQKVLTEEVRSNLALDIVVFSPGLESLVEQYLPFRAPDTARSGTTPRSPCVLIFTSGTTGLPKAAVVPWYRAVFGAAAMAKWIDLGPAASKRPDRLYTAMPLYHSAAFQIGFHLCLICPATLVLSRKFSVSNFWEEATAGEATVIQYVGETLRYLLTAPPDDSVKHHVRLAVGNGLRPDVWERFQQRFGIETIAEFYGATESVFASWNLSRNSFASGAIGQVGLLGDVYSSKMQSIVEVDWETEAPRRDLKTGFCSKVLRGEPGELLYAVDPKDIGARYQGYFDNKAASDSKILRDVHKVGDAWFRSGDVVRFDKQGRMWFSDRIGDTFRWRSENVATTEVAEVLGLHPDVIEANVYGVQIPNHDGRAGCAAVLLKDITSPDIPVPRKVLRSIAKCAQEGLPRYAVPIFLRVLTEVMATGNNKQQKHILRMEGVEPSKINCGDRIFYLEPGSEEFKPFGDEEWDKVQNGKLKV
jgi:acyl-CoA synthetase (AMP-forming)/AMP-acid ligase II